MPDPNTDTVRMVSPEGVETDVPVDQVATYQARQFRIPSANEHAESVVDQARQAQTSAPTALLEGGLRGVTLGASDALQRALGGEDARLELAETQAAHPIASTIGDVGGQVGAALLTGGAGELADAAAATPIGALSRAADAIREGGGVARAVGAGAIEGAGIGLGQGISQVSLSDNPVDVEHVASALSSNVLFGAALGGGAGLAAKGLELGLAKASDALHAAAEGGSKLGGVLEDLAGLDAKGLRAAKASELDRIETERVPRRKALADDIGDYRRSVKDDKLWVATKGSDDADLRVLGKRTLKADRQLDNLLDNPVRLGEKPELAKAALQQQEAAFEDILKKEPNIRSAAQASRSREAIRDEIASGKVDGEKGPFTPEGMDAAVDREMNRRFGSTTPGPSAREAALDKIPAALEKNRQLQQRIADLIAEPKSERLASIADAQDALSVPRGEKSFGARIAGGAAYGKAAAVMGLVPGGHLLAPAVGAMAAKAVEGAIDGVGPTLRAAAKHTADVVDAMLGAAKRAAPVAPVLATEVLRSVRYAPSGQVAAAERAVKPGSDDELHELYAQRSAEIRSQTMYDETGKAVMRPEARARMAARFDGLRATDPIGMDRLESAAAARIEYLANALPRKPDPMANGPDTWRPPELEVRSFVRKMAAVEHPEQVEKRLVDGTITPEDVEAYRAAYPARAQALETQIVSQMGAKGVTLTYERRLAMSMFTGRPMDPSLDPRILVQLQGTFANEEGTGGGTRAPVPKPQFGSVRGDVATPSQERESSLR